MAENAKNLAQELMDSGKASYQETFTITNSQGQTIEDDVIVVVAIRTTKRGRDSLKKLSESIITKAVSGPYGQPCPMCNGSGKI